MDFIHKCENEIYAISIKSVNNIHREDKTIFIPLKNNPYIKKNKNNQDWINKVNIIIDNTKTYMDAHNILKES